MPHTRSAKKQLRKAEKRRLHNRAVKRTIKTEIKKFTDRAITREEIETLKKICNRGLWLQHGSVQMAGSPGEVVAAYKRSVGPAGGAHPVGGLGDDPGEGNGPDEEVRVAA